MLAAQDTDTAHQQPGPAIQRAEDEHDVSSPILQAILKHKGAQNTTTLPSTTGVTMPSSDGFVTSPTGVTTSVELPTRRSGMSGTQASATETMQDDEIKDKQQFAHRASSSEDQQNLISEDEEEVEFVLEATPVPSEKDGTTSDRPSLPGSATGTPRRDRIAVGHRSPPTNVNSNSKAGDYPANEHFGNGVTCRYYNKSRCSKGNDCPFSHAPDLYSLRSHSEGRNVCLYFVHNNKCRFAEPQCNYSHQRGDLLPWDDEEIERQLEFKLGVRKDTLRASTVAKKTLKGDRSHATAAYEERKKAQEQAKIFAKQIQQMASTPANVVEPAAQAKKQSKTRNRSSSSVSLGKKSNAPQGPKAKDVASTKQGQSKVGPTSTAPTKHNESEQTNTSPRQEASVPLSGGVSLSTSSKAKVHTTNPIAELLRMSASSSSDLATRMRAPAVKSTGGDPSSVPFGVMSSSGSQATGSSLSERAPSLLATESSQSMSEQSSPPVNFKRKPNKRGYAPPYAAGANTHPPRWDLPQTLDRLQLLRFGQLRWDSGGNGMGDQNLDTLRALAAIQMGLRAPPTSMAPIPQLDVFHSVDPSVMGYYPVPSLNYGNPLDQAALEHQLRLDHFARYGVSNHGFR